MDFNKYSLGGCTDAECDVRARLGELESVLQQVAHHRSQHFSISLDRHAFVDGHHGQSDPSGVCQERGGRCELVDESGHEESLSSPNALTEANLLQRTANEGALSYEAAMEDSPG